MNSGTLVASLIMAALLAVVIALVIRLMMRGWRERARRQAAMIGTLPPVPETVGSPIVAPTRGVYVGCTLAPDWHDRVAVGDLGYRSKAVLTRYPEGIMVQRSGASPIWIPQETITAIRTERGMVGKVVPPGLNSRRAARDGRGEPGSAASHDGILAIRWRLPSGTEIDLGFRGNDRSEYARWLPENTR
jgi:hypothetical protein